MATIVCVFAFFAAAGGTAHASTPKVPAVIDGIDAHSSYELLSPRRRWPEPVIRYHVAYPAIASVFRRAVGIWNRSGAEVRWRPVSAARAQVTVRRVKMMRLAGWAGQVYRPGTRKKFRPGDRHGSIIKIDPQVSRMTHDRSDPDRPSLNQRLALQIVAHEMGHILGLAHNEECAVMNPTLKIACPDPPGPDLYRCRVLEADDLRGAIRLFGGSARPQGADWCPVSGLPAAVEDLTVTYAPITPPNTVPTLTWSWKLPALDRPGYVGTRIGPADACPGRSPRGPWTNVLNRPPDSSYTRTFISRLPPGEYCANAFSMDIWGVTGPEHATTTFTVPE